MNISSPSNMTTLNAWCRRYKFSTRMAIVKDDPDEIPNLIAKIEEGYGSIYTYV